MSTRPALGGMPIRVRHPYDTPDSYINKLAVTNGCSGSQYCWQKKARGDNTQRCSRVKYHKSQRRQGSIDTGINRTERSYLRQH